MTEKTAIDKSFLQNLLREVQTKAPAIYCVMRELPKEHCYLYRFYDTSNNIEGCEDPASNTFTIQEFYDRFDTFHPDDDFGIYFAVHLDRIDSARAEEYTDKLCLDKRRDATVSDIRENFSLFLESYCEKCLRDNHPFELTSDWGERFGLTPNEIKTLLRQVDGYTAGAKKMIRAEYEALRKLDFIRNEK